MPMKRIIVKGRDWHANISVTEVRREENVVIAERDGAFVGFFDLGAVDCIWVSSEKNDKED